MRVVKWERIGDRRVRLVVWPDCAFDITIEVIGPDDAWVDISLIADSRLRVSEQQAKQTLPGAVAVVMSEAR